MTIACDGSQQAFEAALAALRSDASESEIIAEVRLLGAVLGGKHLKTSSELAILACLDQLVHPSRDQDAWEKRGAKKTAFYKWKQVLRPLMLGLAI